MNLLTFKRLIKTTPSWALSLVLLAVTVNTLYFYYRGQVGIDGQSNWLENGNCVISYVTPGGPAEKAGIREGDILVSVDSMEVHEWCSLYRGDHAGDTLIYGVIRNGKELALPLVLSSPVSFFFGFTVTIYTVLLILSISSLYLLYKKPHDQAVRLFFIYLQVFVVTENAAYLILRDPLANAATFIFQLCTCLIGPVLIHFHLFFPRPINIIKWVKKLPVFFYVAGILFFILYFSCYLLMIDARLQISTFRNINRIVLLWLTLNYFLAVATVIYQFLTIKDTLSRKQLRLVITGSFFGIYTAVALALFPSYVDHLTAGLPYLFNLVQGIGSLIMIACILIAIFHYRIWDFEMFIRKTLLYLGATLIIILCYFLLIYLINKLLISETDLTRFLLLALSVIIFLVLRDWLQGIIDRIFHRETYDSTSVVSGFEEKLAGIYRVDELFSKIGLGLEDIFHFKLLVFSIKTEHLTYKAVFKSGTDGLKTGEEVEVNDEFEKALRKSRVFSIGELNEMTSFMDNIKGELFVPILQADQPWGFFICGQKESEKPYSLQDIRVLSLIAKRVISLFQTASLYQRDLDRQLMLEKERVRISQDMHDDLGASLTRISILSDLAKNKTGIADETGQWLEQISDTSRGVIEEMNQIIWALNPKNDTLSGLIAYIRRFAVEYLEPTGVNCTIEIPEEIPRLALSVELRRNVYLVVREALHNMVKHARATKVLISIKLNQSRFSILISDDGIGFNPGKLESPGNGLINMKKRMNDIAWEFMVSSKPGEGTEILLKGDMKRLPGFVN